MDSVPKSVALVGYGYGGSVFHAPFIEAEPRLSLVAVVTANPQSAGEVAVRYPAAEVVKSLDEIERRSGEYDVVVISTPNATHVPIALRMVEAGVRTVVIDKPVAPTAAAMQALISAATAAKVVMIPFQNRRFDGDFMTVQAILGSGELGQILRFESRFERWQPEIPGGERRAWKQDTAPDAAAGVSFDLGSHLIDQAVTCFGPPAGVYAELRSSRPGRVVDDAFFALEYPNGPAVHLWASLVAAGKLARFRLLGTEGTFTKYGMDPQVTNLLRGRRPGDVDWGSDPETSWAEVVVGDERRMFPTFPGAYERFYARVADVVIDGAVPPVLLTDALVTALVLDAAQRSARDHGVELLEWRP